MLGLPRDVVHYLIKAGHVRPERERRGKKEFLYFTLGDVDRLRRFEVHYRRGVAVQRAMELADQHQSIMAFVLADLAALPFSDGIDDLARLPGIESIIATHGPRADLIVKIRAAGQTELDDLITRRLNLVPGLKNRRTWIVIPSQQWQRPGRPQRSTSTVIAYILIEVAAPNPPFVFDELKQIDGVQELCGVYGDIDMIAKVEVDDLRALDEIVIGRLQKIRGVQATTTLIGISALAWERPEQAPNADSKESHHVSTA